MRRRLLIMALAALTVLPAPSHAATTIACTNAANLGAASSHADAAAIGPYCINTVFCPSSHLGNCVFTATGHASGVGAVGVTAVMGASKVTCGPAAGSCTTPAIVQTVAKGSSRTLRCDFDNGVALLPQVTCRITYP